MPVALILGWLLATSAAATTATAAAAATTATTAATAAPGERRIVAHIGVVGSMVGTRNLRIRSRKRDVDDVALLGRGERLLLKQDSRARPEGGRIALVMARRERIGARRDRSHGSDHEKRRC